MSRFIMPRQGVKGQNLNPADGAKLFFYAVGTTTFKDTYTNAAKSIASTNPVTADATGLFAYIEIDGPYDVVLKDKNGVQLWGPETIQELVDGSEGTAIQELTTATMTADTQRTYAVGDVVTTKEFSTGNDGPGTYDVVLTSGVTPNTFNIIIGVANALISFVLRVDNGTVSAGAMSANGLADSTAAIQAAIDLFTPGPSGGGNVILDAGINYTLASAIIIPPNITVDINRALVTYTGTGVAFTLGTSDSVLSYDCRLLNLNLKLQDKASTGVLLRGTALAHVTGNIEGHTTIQDNTRTNIGLWIDGRDVSSFFNRITLSLGHMHEGFRIQTTGTTQSTSHYFESCDTFGDQDTDTTSIGYSFGLTGSVAQEGQGTVITGGNVEKCNTGFLVGANSGRVTLLGVRTEIVITGTSWKFDFVDGCDPWSLIGVNGLGTTYMEGTSGIRNWDSGNHMLIGADGGEMRLNGFDDPLDAKAFLGIGGSNPQLRFDSGADMFMMLNDTASGTGRMTIQAGRGSADFGASVTLHGDSHASSPGECHIAGSDGFGVQFKNGLSGTTHGQFKNTGVALSTALWLFDADNATLEQVTVGAADSGGTNFKVLRIPN